MSDESNKADAAWQPRLSVWDATSLMIGIVVGTSLFVLPSAIFSNVSSPWAGLGLWTLGGVLSLIGAMVFAEMAVSIPKGGAYAFLTAAFGRPAGLLYGVAVVSIIVTSTIGAMAFAFATYSSSFGVTSSMQPFLAMAAVAVLAVFNTLSLQSGRIVQNLLTAAKLTGLLGIVAAGFFAPKRPDELLTGIAGEASPNFGIAMVLVLYAYGGWSDAASVAAEVRSRQRNIPLALIGGLAGVTAIYVLVNLSFLRLLGWAGLCASHAPARDALEVVAGNGAGIAVSLIVMVSALGAVHGMLFSGSRSVAALGEDHSVFASVGVWSPVRGVPVRAVWLLAMIAILQIGLVGTEQGRSLVDRCFAALRIGAIPWDQFHGGFDTLVAASAPTFWILMLATGLAFFQLRRLGLTPAGFRCPLGFVLPLTYCAVCGFMLYHGIRYAGNLGLIGLLPVAIAALLAPFSRRPGA